jgi:hypothetical protein
VLQIEPQSEKILNTVNLTTLVPNPGCVRITGMAVGPDHQLAIACSASGTASVVISEDFSNNTTPFVHPLAGETGADEMWYNPGDNHYLFASSSHTIPNPAVPPVPPTLPAPQLGVVDAFGDNPPSSAPQEDASAKSALGSHSVAADPVANQVYVPVNNSATGGR